jgi:thiamine biosynthesis lipoprotein
MKWGLLFFWALSGAVPGEEFSYKQPLMGTLFRIKVHAGSEVEASKAAEAAFIRVAELEEIFSDYNADSELMRLIAKPVGQPVKVSRELCDAICQAREISAQTGGAFDITIGQHVRNWRMARRTGKLPDAEKIAAAKVVTGMDKIVVDKKAMTVTLTVPGMRLDFGGIAKGMAADAALVVLKERGFDKAIVAAGGDLAIGAPPPGKPGWVVEILAADGKERTRVLSNVGVSTSGDLEQFIEIEGGRYSHIVDPKTGLGVRHSDSVTVIAPNASISDPLATALSVGASVDAMREVTIIRASKH